MFISPLCFFGMRNLNKMRCLFIIMWDPKEKRSSWPNQANKGNAQAGHRKQRFDSWIRVKGKEIRLGLVSRPQKQTNKQNKSFLLNPQKKMGVGKQVRVIVGKPENLSFPCSRVIWRMVDSLLRMTRSYTQLDSGLLCSRHCLGT